MDSWEALERMGAEEGVGASFSSFSRKLSVKSWPSKITGSATVAFTGSGRAHGLYVLGDSGRAEFLSCFLGKLSEGMTTGQRVSLC